MADRLQLEALNQQSANEGTPKQTFNRLSSVEDPHSAQRCLTGQ